MLLPKQSPRQLKILFVLPPFLPTPPHGYGGIEAVAAALLPELQRAGARLTVTTPYGSSLKVSELRTITEPLYSILSQAYNNVAPKIELYISKVMHLAWQGQYDVIHDYTGVMSVANTLAAPLHGAGFPPVVHTVHGPIEPYAENYAELVKYPGFSMTAISRSQLSEAPMTVRRHTTVIYNCLNPSDYEIGPGGGRLLVLGRITHDKGQDRLVRFCAEEGIELDIAGPVAEMTDLDQIMSEVARGAKSSYRDNPDFQMFTQMLPFIDGTRIRFHANVSGAHKQRLLAEARALVIPNRWSEPFGMVAIEAMASGTPVLAMSSGAMPELIRPGVTGYLAGTFDQLCEYIRTNAASAIDRARCRRHVERNFSAESIAQDLLKLYRRIAVPIPIGASLGLGLRPQPQPSVLYERIPSTSRRAKPQI